VRLDAGKKALGWKVGFGAPASMERLRTTVPLVGFLMHRGLLTSGVTLPVSRWTQTVLEPEIAVYLGENVAAGADGETARAAISGVGPAIGIVDLDRPPGPIRWRTFWHVIFFGAMSFWALKTLRARVVIWTGLWATCGKAM
jgi:2-keto-4-pentenoate hydratase